MPAVLANGISMYYEVDPGPPATDEAPLVLLHVFTGTLAQWAAVRPILAAEHRVICCDLRGHGRSDAPDDLAAYTMETYARDLLGLLDALGIEQAHVLGSAFGAMVALEFALRHPGRVRTLILADPSAGPRCVELSEPIAAMEAGLERALAYAGEHGLSAAVERELATDPALRGDPHRREHFEKRWRQMTLHGFRGAGKARAERPDHHHDLERLTMPVLIVVGDRDVLVPEAEYMHAHIPRSALRQIAGAGHPAVADQPHGFAAVVRGFLKGYAAE